MYIFFIIILVSEVNANLDDSNRWRIFQEPENSFVSRIFLHGNRTSQNCQLGVNIFRKELMEGKEWALKMMDACGRPRAGVLEGSLSWPGSYEECFQLKISQHTRELEFQGKYCIIKFKSFNAIVQSNFTSKIVDRLNLLNSEMRNALQLRLGICIPSTCTADDITSVVAHSITEPSVDTSAVDVSCEDVHTTFKISTEMLVMICICCVVLLSVSSATVADIYKSNTGTKPESNGLMMKTAMGFSAFKNASRIMEVNKNSSESLGSLHGLRFFSVCWIVLLHTYYFVPLGLFNRVQKQKAEKYYNVWFEAVSAGSYAVDTFLLLSGLLVSYVFLRKMSKPNGKFNILTFYFHRWWRLTPVYMMILATTTVFSPLMMSGPFAKETMVRFGDCASNWWTNLLYINNFVNLDTMCISHSWYLACDMQMYIISPLILYPLKVWPLAGLLINSFFLLASMVAPAVITAENHYPIYAKDGGNAKLISYYQEIYMKPYCRMVPYCVGIFVGYLIYYKKEKIRFNKKIKAFGWICSTLSALCLIYGVNTMHKAGLGSFPLSISYAASSKLVWSLILAWVVITTTTGNATTVDAILSWKSLVPGSRLSYCLFLIHPAILYINTANMNQPVFFSHLYLVKLFLAVLVIAIATSFIYSITIEIPFMNLEKIITEYFDRTKKDPALRSDMKVEKDCQDESCSCRVTGYQNGSFQDEVVVVKL